MLDESTSGLMQFPACYTMRWLQYYLIAMFWLRDDLEIIVRWLDIEPTMGLQFDAFPIAEWYNA